MNAPAHVSQSDIDRAREALENANFKLGKARARSITSTAEASRDVADLKAAQERAAAAETAFTELTERFIAQSSVQLSQPARAAVIDADDVFLTELEAKVDSDGVDPHYCLEELEKAHDRLQLISAARTDRAGERAGRLLEDLETGRKWLVSLEADKPAGAEPAAAAAANVDGQTDAARAAAPNGQAFPVNPETERHGAEEIF